MAKFVCRSSGGTRCRADSNDSISSCTFDKSNPGTVEECKLLTRSHRCPSSRRRSLRADVPNEAVVRQSRVEQGADGGMCRWREVWQTGARTRGSSARSSQASAYCNYLANALNTLNSRKFANEARGKEVAENVWLERGQSVP